MSTHRHTAAANELQIWQKVFSYLANNIYEPRLGLNLCL